MGILNKVEKVLTNLKNSWKALPLKTKIDIILDATCSIGSGIMSAKLATSMTRNSSILEKVCVRTTMTGLGIAAGDISSKALRENYHSTMEAVKEAQEKVKKEAAANE